MAFDSQTMTTAIVAFEEAFGLIPRNYAAPLIEKASKGAPDLLLFMKFTVPIRRGSTHNCDGEWFLRHGDQIVMV